MSNFNVFMNSYQQPENKLTYNLLCLIEHMPRQKKFLEFLLGKEIELASEPFVSGKSVFSGYKSNPDGKLVLKKSDGTTLNLYLENKTDRLGLTHDQIKKYVNEFCKDDNSYLFVITPRGSDNTIVDDCQNELGKRIYFRTWQETVEFLKEINSDSPNFVVQQFIEYGKIKGEFEDMRPTIEDIKTFVKYYENRPEDKIKYIIENAVQQTTLKLLHDEMNWWWSKKDGRMGIQLEFYETSKFSNPYGLWLFFGIYFDERDHAIPFKNKSELEITLFLDIYKDYRDNIINIPNFNNIVKALEKEGFEDNSSLVITPNEWKLFFHRTPIFEFGELTIDKLKNHFTRLMNILFRNKELFQSH